MPEAHRRAERADLRQDRPRRPQERKYEAAVRAAQTRGPQSRSLPESLSKTLPAVLRREEVLHFLGSVEDIEHQAILTTCYAAGLHISEAVRLKTSWLDNQRVVIRAAQGSLIVESSAHYLALLTSSHRPSTEIAYHRRC